MEEVYFPADCKCSFLCCFLNDLGNFRNHKTINTYIHFVLFCFGSMCKLWQEQLLFIFRSPGPTILLLKKEVKTPISYHASGYSGMLSRIINPLLGGQIAFCIDRYKESSIMEQIDLKTAKTIVENTRKIVGDL